MSKLGKLYELMAYGDDLDAFYSMNKRVTKAIHTECDREIMELLDEAKKDLLGEHLEINGKVYDNTAEAWKAVYLDLLERLKKWFGEP